MYFDLNLFFLLGIVSYLLLFFLATRKPKAKAISTEKPGERVKTIRLSIAALLISIALVVFQPYWSPAEKQQEYGFDRMLILGTGVMALITLFVLLRREAKKQVVKR